MVINTINIMKIDCWHDIIIILNSDRWTIIASIDHLWSCYIIGCVSMWIAKCFIPDQEWNVFLGTLQKTLYNKSECYGWNENLIIWPRNSYPEQKRAQEMSRRPLFALALSTWVFVWMSQVGPAQPRGRPVCGKNQSLKRRIHQGKIRKILYWYLNRVKFDKYYLLLTNYVCF